MAGQIREGAGPAFLYGSMAAMFPKIDTAAFKIFRDRLLADAGNPSDPIEVMMIEQIVLAHMNIGRLQFKSATSDSLDAAKVYGGLAIQLLGEFRRTCLGLQALRTSTRSATGTIANPSTAVAAGDVAESKAPARAAGTDPPDPELVSKEARHDDEAGRRNRALRLGLSPEGRERARAAALLHQPWRFATGPRTPEGKAKAAANGNRRQEGQKSLRELRTELGGVSRLIQAMAAARRLPG
jgi:hypothetical protein